ncbi:MAG: serine hydrolase domain-containing protein [Bacteroidota bacterium]
MVLEYKIKTIFPAIFCAVFMLSCETVDKTSEPIEEDNLSKYAYSSWVDSIFLEHFTQLNTSNLKLTQTPGAAIVVVKDSSILFQQLFGVKSVASKSPVDTNTIFRIGSLSKGFTGTLAAKLHHKGIIDLYAPVSQYLPKFKLSDPEQTKRIKLIHLLSHSIGLPPHSYTLDIEAGNTAYEILPLFEKVDLVGQEGTHFYQNAAFALIEQIIENQTNKSFREVLYEELLGPLEMSSVTSTHEQFIDHGNYSYSHKWNKAFQRYQVAPFKKKYYSAVSAGGLSASSADMAKWLIALLGNAPLVLSDSTLNIAFTSFVSTHTDLRGFNQWEGVDSTFYGLGWRILQYKNRELIYHGGYVDEFRSGLLIDRSKRLGICVLFNSTSSYSNQVILNFLHYFDLLATVKSELE